MLNPALERCKVLGVPMYAGRLSGAVRHVIETCTNGKKLNRCVSATGAHGLVTSPHDRGGRRYLRIDRYQTFFFSPSAAKCILPKISLGNKHDV
jgi:hypothetical protein